MKLFIKLKFEISILRKEQSQSLDKLKFYLRCIHKKLSRVLFSNAILNLT